MSSPRYQISLTLCHAHLITQQDVNLKRTIYQRIAFIETATIETATIETVLIETIIPLSSNELSIAFLIAQDFTSPSSHEFFKQYYRSFLVQGLVVVAALGGLDAGWAAVFLSRIWRLSWQHTCSRAVRKW